MNKRILIIVGIIALTGIVVGLAFYVPAKISAPSTAGSQSVYDAFLGINTPKDQPKDPAQFYIYNNQSLSTYFNNVTVTYITNTLARFGQTVIDPKIYRAKMTNDPIVAPGNGTVSFKIIYDSADTSVYTVHITQVPQQAEFSSFTITNQAGKSFDLLSGN